MPEMPATADRFATKLRSLIPATPASQHRHEVCRVVSRVVVTRALRSRCAAVDACNMDVDDALYVVSMLMFASIPIEALAKPPAAFTPSRVAATLAFCLLELLQLRKGYAYGIVLVTLNLGLRIAADARSLLRPLRRSRSPPPPLV